VLEQIPLREPEQPVDRPEERGQGFPGTGRRGEERVGARGDGGPARGLDRRRLAEAVAEPVRDERGETGHDALEWYHRPRRGATRVGCSLAPEPAEQLYMAAVPARPTSSRQARRAAARAADRATRAQPTPPVVARTIRSLPLASNIWWGSVLLALLAFTATNIVRKITWYLAVDQFGYLVFAHDLLHGHVLHHWPPLDALIGRLPPRADILAQTYVADGARAYCRYSPGFPILLAAWLRIFGDNRAADRPRAAARLQLDDVGKPVPADAGDGGGALLPELRPGADRARAPARQDADRLPAAGLARRDHRSRARRRAPAVKPPDHAPGQRCHPARRLRQRDAGDRDLGRGRGAGPAADVVRAGRVLRPDRPRLLQLLVAARQPLPLRRLLHAAAPHRRGYARHPRRRA